MLIRTRSKVGVALAAAALLPVGAASAAKGPPPPPTAVNGKAVETVAHGVTTPTSFAFAGDTVFAGSGPAEGGPGPTGLFTLAGGNATQVPATPKVVFGLAWHGQKLYVSSGADIRAFSGWDGTRFASGKLIARAPKGGFNGLTFAPDGRLYAGVSFRPKFDPGGDPSRYAQSVVSMTASGKQLRTVAKGLRQPFQLHVPTGKRYPYVGVLGQEKAPVPHDAIVVARPGANFGYPKCLFGVGTTCKGFTKPFMTFPKHASPMGITSIGQTLYVSLFGGLGKGPIVAQMPLAGGTPKPFLQGFVAPVIALGSHNGRIYVGDLTGTIYAVDA